VLLVVLSIIAANALFTEEQYEERFSQWMVENNKNYAPEELFRRFEIFMSNMDFVQEHNSNPANTYTVGLNQFADLTKAEYKTYHLGFNADLMTAKEKAKPRETNVPRSGTYPSGDLDWVLKGAVTPIKNQGQCGSCWAFSAVSAAEGTIQINKGHLTSLSEQELVDCAGAYGNYGCSGGWMDSAFKYMMSNGLALESDYVYTGVNGICKSASYARAADTKLTGYVDITGEDALGKSVDMEPVTVAIEADQAGFQMYTGGVFAGTCGYTLDHGVTVVGYGTDPASGMDYWKIKNSWGTGWGEQGYMRMVRNRDECGIASMPSYPTA